MSISRIYPGIAVLIAILALGATAPPAHADDLSRVAAERGYTVYGPTCRFAVCWAVIADAAGVGTVLRGRGVIGTRALVARRLDEMVATDQDVKPVLTCIVAGDGIEL